MDKMTDVNYKGLVACAVTALPYLKASKDARVVVVSSLLGVAAGPTRSFYCGTKFGLLGFFDSFREEMAMTNGYQHISVTMVYPGRVATDLNRTRLGKNPARFDDRASMSSEDAASIVVEALHKPWIRDCYFGVQGKLLAIVKGSLSDAGDWVMSAVITRVQKKTKSQ